MLIGTCTFQRGNVFVTRNFIQDTRHSFTWRVNIWAEDEKGGQMMVSFNNSTLHSGSNIIDETVH